MGDIFDVLKSVEETTERWRMNESFVLFAVGRFRTWVGSKCSAGEIERLKRIAAEKIGELVTALGILPPGEDAVANFDQVIDAARRLQARMEELERHKARDHVRGQALWLILDAATAKHGARLDPWLAEDVHEILASGPDWIEDEVVIDRRRG